MAEESVDLAVLRRVALVSAKMDQGSSLDETLQAVADGVVDALGFGAAAVNYVLPDGDLQVLAVAGPPEACDLLAGTTVPKADMDGLLERSEAWGMLRFVPEERFGSGTEAVWTPTYHPSDDVLAWQPEDALFAPLRGSDGEMVGVLSVDLPPGLRRPDALLRELLEVFALQAGLAIGRARLLAQLQVEHARLLASEAAFRFSFEGSAGAMAMLGLGTDHLGRFDQVNDAFCAAVGYTRDELDRLSWMDLIFPDERPRSTARLLRLAQGDQVSHRTEVQMRRADGTAMWAEVTLTVIVTGDGRVEPFLLLHLEDVTGRRSREEALRREAQIDPLTGLANRLVLLDALAAAQRGDDRPGPVGFLFYGDLDRFKRINDQYGHVVGDLVLKETAERLKACVRAGDVVARLGGDEFVVLAVGLEERAATELRERIRAAFAVPMSAVEESVMLSLGMTPLGAGAPQGLDGLLERADRAMYAVKHAGRGS